MLPGFGKAKSVIIFYLYGAPPQMETLDPKPDSPSVKEGGIKSIPSSIPGIHVADLLPEIGKRLHNFALIRSMSHSSNNHAVSVALSGLSKSVPAIEANGQDKRHAPYIGSVLEFLLKQQGVDASVTGVPVHMLLPWRLKPEFGSRTVVTQRRLSRAGVRPDNPTVHRRGVARKGASDTA